MLTFDTLIESKNAYEEELLYENESLIIIFSAQNPNGQMWFDFFSTIKNLETERGKPINKLFVRDNKVYNYHNGAEGIGSFYQRSIEGMGENPRQVADTISRLIDKIKPSMVSMMGVSMGGYAAIMFGAMLKVDNVVAFGTRTFLKIDMALAYNEMRHTHILNSFRETPLPEMELDLFPLCKTCPDTKIHLFFGSKPRGEANWININIDALYAIRMHSIDNVILHPYENLEHEIAQVLIKDGLFNQVVGKLLLT